MEFKGAKGKWEVVEHNWSDTSIYSNGKTVCKFELDDIDEEDLTENDLSEEENQYNILLISKAPEMLEGLKEALKFAKMKNNETMSEYFKKLIKEATEL